VSSNEYEDKTAAQFLGSRGASVVFIPCVCVHVLEGSNMSK